MSIASPGRALRVVAVPVGDVSAGLPTSGLLGDAVGFEVSVVDAGPSRAAETASREQMDVALVVADGGSPDALLMIERLLRARPEMAVVVLQTGGPDAFLEAALSAGAEDVLVAPQPADAVAQALRKAYARANRSRSATVGLRQGRIVAVIGPKGGSGKTMCSTNLAATLARSGHRTLLLDLDLEFGDCAIVLGLRPERTIADLMSAGGSLDEEKLAGFVSTHAPTGLHVLIGPARPDQADMVSVGGVEEIFAVARATYDFIIVDSAPAFSPIVIATVDAADEVILLASMDVPSLKDARLGLDTLELMGRRRDDVRVALNRANAKGGLALARVTEALEREVDLVIPSDSSVPNSYNEGVPMIVSHPKNGVSKAIAQLATSVSGSGDQKRTWLRRGGRGS